VAALRPTLHVFGHTHIPIDLTLDPDPRRSGRRSRRRHWTRFLQWPLGYPKEHRRQTAAVAARGPLLVWRSDGAAGARAGGVSNGRPYGFDDGAAPGAADVVEAAAAAAAGRGPDRLQPPEPTFWGDYYRAHARDASATQQAPWVLEFHRRAKAQRQAQSSAAAAPTAAPTAAAAGSKLSSSSSSSSRGSSSSEASVDREIHSASVDGLWQQNRTATAAALESESASD
jgi:hypothetical protein